MRWRLGLKTTNPLTDWDVLFLGNTERWVAVALVVWAPTYLPGFIGGWVLLKFALGWQAKMSDKPQPWTESRNKLRPLTKEEDREKLRQESMLAMIGSVLSFTVAIGIGYVLHSA